MPADTYNKKLKYSKTIKLNRKSLNSVIDAYVRDGQSAGQTEWKKACDRGVRQGKLDEASVDECIAHVSQEVKAECRKQTEPKMSDSDLKSMSKIMQKLASKYV